MMELKPCPFCGGEAEAVYGFYDYNYWGVMCKECGCYIGGYEPKEKHIEAWNRRVGEHK